MEVSPILDERSSCSTWRIIGQRTIHRVARGILAFGLFCAAPGFGPVAPDGLARSAVVHLDAYSDHFFFIGAHHRRAAPAPITAAVATHADSRTIAVV